MRSGDEGNSDQDLRPWFVYTLHDPELPQEVRYVGWTTRPKRRLWAHLQDAKTGKDRTYCGNWKRTVLARGLEPAMQVIEQGVGDGWKPVEVHWIKHYRDLGHPITNLTNGGDGSGKKLTPAQKKKIGDANRGKVRSAETRARLSAAHKGYKHTPEQTAKIAAANRGRKQSEEVLRRRRGRKMSSEAVAKSAEARRGQQRSPEVRAKMRASHLGKRLAPEHAANIAKAHLGLKRTEDQRRRISDAIRAWHVARKDAA